MPTDKPFVKTENAHYLKGHASWLYCDGCNKTVAYLCYVTYSHFRFEFDCLCGTHGYAENYFSNDSLENFPLGKASCNAANRRYCCEKEKSPLFSPVPKNLKSYSADVVCKACGTRYKVES